MSGIKWKKPFQILKPKQSPPPPPAKLCQKAEPRRGAPLKVLQKNVVLSLGSNTEKSDARKKPRMPEPNRTSCQRPAPPTPPVTPTGPPPAYECPINVLSIRPQIAPKPGDLVVLQRFFGLWSVLDVETARRLACSTNRDGSTPLHQAARRSCVKEVGALIRMGANVEAGDALGFRPVHKAAAAGSVQVLQQLQFVGADLEAQGNHGYRPIHMAAMNGGMEAVRWLVEHGSPVDDALSGGWTALHLAVWWDREPVVRCLLDLSASVNYINDHGMTPLGMAISGGHDHLARLLVSYGGVVE